MWVLSAPSNSEDLGSCLHLPSGAAVTVLKNRFLGISTSRLRFYTYGNPTSTIFASYEKVVRRRPFVSMIPHAVVDTGNRLKDIRALCHFCSPTPSLRSSFSFFPVLCPQVCGGGPQGRTSPRPIVHARRYSYKAGAIQRQIRISTLSIRSRCSKSVVPSHLLNPPYSAVNPSRRTKHAGPR